ncbi:MAG: hypothetical protein E7171_04935 [Firmicutes bacterium]|nr:hypothetical protein [Bacillota bacterium]
MKKFNKLTILSILTSTVIMTSSVPVDKTTNSYISSYYDVLLDDITSEYVLVDERVNYVPQNNYVPQGIALVGDYFLTSNFDYYKDKNSMICVIDKDGKLVHKCMLDHDAHVGGIAYDEVNGLLFVTGYSGYILAYDIEDILHKDKVTAKYSNINVGDGLSNYVYPWVNSASFISIHDNELLVGNFSLRNTGKVKRYKYSIVEDEIKLEYVSSFKIPDMVQGITFYKKDDKEYIIFSRSYGRDCPSVMQIFRYSEDIKNYRDEKLVSSSLRLEPMLEQITSRDNNIYALYESNARPYTVNQDTEFDSIPVIDADSLVKKLELKIDTD